MKTFSFRTLGNVLNCEEKKSNCRREREKKGREGEEEKRKKGREEEEKRERN